VSEANVLVLDIFGTRAWVTFSLMIAALWP